MNPNHMSAYQYSPRSLSHRTQGRPTLTNIRFAGKPILLLALILSLLVSSCQKVINVKLNGSAAKYVIEGVVTDQPGACTVNITTTKDFSGNNSFTGVPGASVTIQVDGATFPLTDQGGGLYSTTAINGTPGKTYTMTALIEGENYTGSSTMPQAVGLDSMYINKAVLSDKNYVTVIYTDPIGVANYYRWVQFVNGLKEKTIFTTDDEFTDGLRLTNQLNYNNDTDDPKRDILDGDTVRIDMICMDKSVYQYWYSLNNQASGSGGSASPSNPVSNISGGCLGYFSAQTIRSKTTIFRK